MNPYHHGPVQSGEWLSSKMHPCYTLHYQGMQNFWWLDIPTTHLNRLNCVIQQASKWLELGFGPDLQSQCLCLLMQHQNLQWFHEKYSIISKTRSVTLAMTENCQLVTVDRAWTWFLMDTMLVRWPLSHCLLFELGMEATGLPMLCPLHHQNHLTPL